MDEIVMTVTPYWCGLLIVWGLAGVCGSFVALCALAWDALSKER